MPESLPPACAHCQKLLSLGPENFVQPEVRNHLIGCATCSRLSAQYREIERLLNQVPDLKPLPALALRFQQIPQARHISELHESFATWEGMVEEKSPASLFKPWPGEAGTSPLAQGKAPLQKHSLASPTKPTNDLTLGQFQLPLQSTQRPRRPFWQVMATAATVALVLVTICAWMLLPRLNQPGATGHSGGTRTAVPATPTSTRPATQNVIFTEQDSGRTVKYDIAARIAIILNQQKYPAFRLQLSCEPPGALRSVVDPPYAVSAVNYVVEYQANEAGTCTIKNGSFVLTVVITQSSGRKPASD